jgi:hypothetical protein
MFTRCFEPVGQIKSITSTINQSKRVSVESKDLIVSQVQNGLAKARAPKPVKTGNHFVHDKVGVSLRLGVPDAETFTEI